MTLHQWRAKRRRQEFFLCLVVYGVGAAALTWFAFFVSRVFVGAA